MKPEPLTNLKGDLELKTKEANEELEILLNTLLTGGVDNKGEALELIFSLLEEFRNEIRQDVKSAVKWLLKEIEKREEEIKKAKEEAERRGHDDYERHFLGWIKGLQEVKYTIMEAFEGVME